MKGSLSQKFIIKNKKELLLSDYSSLEQKNFMLLHKLLKKEQ